MRILPINYFSPKINNHNDCSQYSVLRTPSLDVDTVCFKGGAQPQDITTLKKLLAYNIPDMYSGRIMLDPQEVERILQAKIFSKPLKKIILFLKKYEGSLFPVEHEIFSMLQKDAKTFPNIKLGDAVHRHTLEAMIDLRQKQAPIFAELTVTAQQLPPAQLVEFNQLMEITHNRLYDKSVVLPFSAKEFSYKLQRIFEGIKARGIPAEIKTMRKLINMSYSLPESVTGRTKPHAKKPIDRTNSIAGSLRQMTQISFFSPLRNDKELNDLLTQTKLKLYNIPLVAPFSRKSFIHDLKKILNNVDNPKLVRELEKIASKLPTAKEEVSAFIMKSATNSSEKIGYDLIFNSVGTAEHILPSKHGGSDFIGNIALASFAANSERGHRHMDTQLRIYPETYDNCQKYVDRLIELYNDGTFAKLGISRQYITGFANKMYKMSPPEKRMILDTSALKD